MPAKLDRLAIIGRLYPLKDACVLSGSRADLKQRISELRDALDALIRDLYVAESADRTEH